VLAGETRKIENFIRTKVMQEESEKRTCTGRKAGKSTSQKSGIINLRANESREKAEDQKKESKT